MVNLGSSSFQGLVGTVAVMESRSALVYDVGFWHRPAAPTGKSERWTRSSGLVLHLRPSFWKKETPKSHGQHPFGFVVVAVFSFLLFSDMSQTCPSRRLWSRAHLRPGLEVRCSQILAEYVGLRGPAQPRADIRRTGSHK